MVEIEDFVILLTRAPWQMNEEDRALTLDGLLLLLLLDWKALDVLCVDIIDSV